MGQKLVIGPNKGLTTNVTAFNIDNDAFAQLLNAYQWRKRVKRKRGTSNLSRLQRFLAVSVTLSGGSANILTAMSIPGSPAIVPGSINLVGSVDGSTYTDPAMDGTLVGTGGTGTGGTINYATSVITINSGGTETLTGSVYYYPCLPVLGLEDFTSGTAQYPITVAFDTTYSYIINSSFPYTSHDVSYYNNPSSSGDYLAKSTWTPLKWNGQNYQQFWTTNFQGAMWTTNGINVPFAVTNIGMQYKAITNVTVVSGGPPAKATLTITAHGLVVGDYVFVNEVSTTTGINFQTGFVITVTDANNVIVEFPAATIATDGTGGIAQYLTNTAIPTKDCLRWFNGDPTNGAAFLNNQGWVNFCPPLSQFATNISDAVASQYYLCGARMVLPFKDRLLFFGPVIQTSSAGSQIYLQDSVIWGQNGTPYYTCSFTGDPSLPTTVFTPLLVPSNQTATASAYFTDQSGFGGWLDIGIDQPIVTASLNEDVLILGSPTIKGRLVFSGNDLSAFNFFFINVEYGDSSTFSAVNFDKGVITRGARGFIITSQTNGDRIDLPIIDQVFQMQLSNNGNERMCAQRDFRNEWIFFTYTSVSDDPLYDNIFPTQTVLYNYRDNSWAVFNETFTTYGQFRAVTGMTWETVGTIYPTWESWTANWEDGATDSLEPTVIGGNAQGFVMTRDDGTDEANSLYIKAISGNTITSPNHCLNNGDYIVISGCLGMSGINGNIYSVSSLTVDTFQLVSDYAAPTGTYLGSGVIKRLYVPIIKTREFPPAWSLGRKTRIGVQQYLLSATANSEITLNIYLSTAPESYNRGTIVPSPNSFNESLVYSSVLYTCPESTNLGLTPSNVNLQMPTSTQSQPYIWHRMNTSLIGDTVQLGFTMSDEQMRATNDNGTPKNAVSEIEIHSMILDLNAASLLS